MLKARGQVRLLTSKYLPQKQLLYRPKSTSYKALGRGCVDKLLKLTQKIAYNKDVQRC